MVWDGKQRDAVTVLKSILSYNGDRAKPICRIWKLTWAVRMYRLRHQEAPRTTLRSLKRRENLRDRYGLRFLKLSGRRAPGEQVDTVKRYGRAYRGSERLATG